MSGQLTRVTENLREMIMRGSLAQGERIKEVALAHALGVSRTPVRLALAILEKENLVEGRPNRGFSVRRFTLEYVTDTITVRSTLEGMAARLAAERGLSKAESDILNACIGEHELDICAHEITELSLKKFSELNKRYHETIIRAANSNILLDLIEKMAPIPFRTAPLLLDLGKQHAKLEMEASLRDHKIIFEAISSGSGTRAEFAMREHALIPLKQTSLLMKKLDLKTQRNKKQDTIQRGITRTGT